MNDTQIIGVDPGLVHTGVVSLVFRPRVHEVHVHHRAIAGPDAPAVSQFVNKELPLRWIEDQHIFIEGYRPRSHFDSDARMTDAVNQMRRILKGTVLNNTGVKKVIKQDLMELLGCWKFSTVTHHQDLRSAARIALLGMAKDERLNELLTLVVTDHLAGETWRVHH